MKIALVHNHFDAAHLETVKAQMANLGAPTIKAIWMECYGHFAAIEGCHRVRAARELCLTPIIDEVEYSNDIAAGTDGLTIEQICDSSYNSEIIEF